MRIPVRIHGLLKVEEKGKKKDSKTNQRRSLARSNDCNFGKRMEPVANINQRMS